MLIILIISYACAFVIIKTVKLRLKEFSLRWLGLERTGLLGMFLFVCPNLLSVLSNFIPGAPFLENWIDNVEKVSISDVNEHSENMDHDRPSNVEHVTALMTGIIMGRFGKSHNPSCADFIQSAT